MVHTELLPAPWEEILRKAWDITDDADVRWLVARLGPQSFKTMTEPVRRTNPAAAWLPRTFIRCTHDPRSDSPLESAAQIARAPGSGWRYRELATGHDAMVTAPRELADLLLEVV